MTTDEATHFVVVQEEPAGELTWVLAITIEFVGHRYINKYKNSMITPIHNVIFLTPACDV
jgi:hypothetical protein